MTTRHQVIQAALDENARKLEESLADVQHSRGALQDALKVVLPIFQEQNKIMCMLFAELGNVDYDMRSRTDPRLFSGQ